MELDGDSTNSMKFAANDDVEGNHQKQEQIMRSKEEGETPVITASCYVYSHGGRSVTGPRVVDAATVTAEAMTQADFSSYRKTHVDTATETFIEKVRDAVLCSNHDGAFLKVGISPATLSDDWILRATEFVRLLNKTETKENKNDCNSTADDTPQRKPLAEKLLRFGVAEKLMNRYSDRWLNVEIVDCSGDAAIFELPLVLVTGRDDELAAPCLNQIMKKIRDILVDSFPHHNVCLLQNAQALLRACTGNDRPVQNNNSGKELGDTLARLQEMRKRGATKEEIVLGMKQVRQSRRQNNPLRTMEPKDTDGIDSKPHIEPLEEDEESQALLPETEVSGPFGATSDAKSAVSDKKQTLRQQGIMAGPYYSYCAKLLLVIAVTYFVYGMMKAPRMVRYG